MSFMIFKQTKKRQASGVSHVSDERERCHVNEVNNGKLLVSMAIDTPVCYTRTKITNRAPDRREGAPECFSFYEKYEGAKLTSQKNPYYEVIGIFLHTFYKFFTNFIQKEHRMDTIQNYKSTPCGWLQFCLWTFHPLYSDLS